MADGSQQGFNFTRPLASALRQGEIVLDFFAGGGGASEALRQALGRDPDVAVNHDHQAIGMHAANHPFARHMEADVWTVDIRREVAGRLVGWGHFSPDCTDFSQAKGGQPRSKATRSLSWVVVKVAGTLARDGLAPRIISLENVKQILKWGPLVAKRDQATGRVVKVDGTVAAPGEHVPRREQFLVPDKRRAGHTWQRFVAALRALGYVVEWRTLRACDYGAGTSRERLFMVARRDGKPIRWPAPTHGPDRAQPYVTAADCIDWSVPCPSIFTRRKALAAATCRRIAKGVHRYVLGAAEPFIVQCANASANGVAPSSDPLGVVTAWPKGGTHAVVAPTLVQTGYGERAGQEPRVPGLHKPVGTLVDGQKHALVTAFLEQAHGGGENGNPARARGADEPVSTISTTGSQQRLVTGTVVSFDEACAEINAIGAGAPGPGDRSGLSPEHEAGALRVAAFLMRYHGTGGQHAELGEPITTVTTKDRLALVTVILQGTPYVIVDIGLRMLRPHELYRAQGFPPGYIIDRTADGSPLSISASVRMVGNSVSPPPLAAIARANLDQITKPEALAA